MEISIEIKPSYIILQVSSSLLDEATCKKLTQVIQEQKLAGSNSFIINLAACQDMDFNAGNTLMDLHHGIYEHHGSIVFCEVNNDVLQKLKKEQLHLTLNLTPTLIEAVDIISMEALERDLFNE